MCECGASEAALARFTAVAACAAGQPCAVFDPPRLPAACPHPAAPPRSKERIDRIQELRWTHRTLPEHVKANLSLLELQYFRSYDKLLNKYMRSGGRGVGLDLTADPMPPDDPYVQVGGEEGVGEGHTSTGGAAGQGAAQLAPPACVACLLAAPQSPQSPQLLLTSARSPLSSPTVPPLCLCRCACCATTATSCSPAARSACSAARATGCPATRCTRSSWTGCWSWWAAGATASHPCQAQPPSPASQPASH